MNLVPVTMALCLISFVEHNHENDFVFFIAVLLLAVRCVAFRIVSTPGLVGFFYSFDRSISFVGLDFFAVASPKRKAGPRKNAWPSYGKSTFENIILVPLFDRGFLGCSCQLASAIHREQEGCNYNRNYD